MFSHQIFSSLSNRFFPHHFASQNNFVVTLLKHRSVPFLTLTHNCVYFCQASQDASYARIKFAYLLQGISYFLVLTSSCVFSFKPSNVLFGSAADPDPHSFLSEVDPRKPKRPLKNLRGSGVRAGMAKAVERLD